ncbi:MAG: hypothetical protein RJA44_764 [Pseudomonadota bacterium]
MYLGRFCEKETTAMATKPNYQFEKRQRELEKKKKKIEKQQKKAQGADVPAREHEAAPDGSSLDASASSAAQ